MKRRILHKLVLPEISAVDKPCQEGARALIMKHDKPEPTKMDEVSKLEEHVDHLLAKVDQLTSSLASTASTPCLGR